MLRRDFLIAVPVSWAMVDRAVAAQHAAMTGPALPGLEVFDQKMRGLMRRHDAPGASLCMAKGGRLVYARGFGWAWKEGNLRAGPETVFGWASVSKAITAIAVLKQVDQGKYGLDDPAFALLPKLSPRPGERLDPRARKTTVRNLLNHSGGYKKNAPRQAVARAFGLPSSQLRERHVVEFFMGKPLDFDPGSEQHYSNFGFTVLGAIVEAVAGREYDQAVNQLVLEPMGVRNVRWGHGEPYDRKTARGYGAQGQELPPIDIMGGAAGGLMAPAAEIVRLLSALDGVRGEAFLSRRAMHQMLAPPQPPLKRRPNGKWFGLGWDVVSRTPRGPSYAKNGGMAGVRSFVGHMPDNIDWAVVFNGGRDVQGEPGQDADAFKTITEAAGQIDEWPKGDLFPRLGRSS